MKSRIRKLGLTVDNSMLFSLYDIINCNAPNVIFGANISF